MRGGTRIACIGKVGIAHTPSLRRVLLDGSKGGQGLGEVPGWLVPAYVRSVQSAGSPQSKEDLSAACRSLIVRWVSPDRAYHGLHHVIELLTRLETLLPETHEPSLVRLAAWYHGIVFSTAKEDTYTRRGGENIAASATAAQTHLLELGVDPTKAYRVSELIRGMKPSETKSVTETGQFQGFDVDELALRDAHLGTLAVDPQRYKRYLELVSQEYAHIPRLAFLHARRDIVTRLLARRQLFLTPLARQWDGRARENLEAEQERLTRLIAQEEATVTEASSPHESTTSPRVEERELSHSQPCAVLNSEHSSPTPSEIGRPHALTQVQESKVHPATQPFPTGTRDDEILPPTSEELATHVPSLSDVPAHISPTESEKIPLTARIEEPSTGTFPALSDTQIFPAVRSAQSTSETPDSSTPRSRSITASFLAASAQANEAERIEEEREAVRISQIDLPVTPAIRKSDLVSGMESCHNLVDPGVPKREAITAEERKKKHREEVAEELRRRIHERHMAACAAKEARTSTHERSTHAATSIPPQQSYSPLPPPPPGSPVSAAENSVSSPSALSPTGNFESTFDAADFVPAQAVGAESDFVEESGTELAGFPSQEQVSFFTHFSTDDLGAPEMIALSSSEGRVHQFDVSEIAGELSDEEKPRQSGTDTVDYVGRLAPAPGIVPDRAQDEAQSESGAKTVDDETSPPLTSIEREPNL